MTKTRATHTFDITLLKRRKIVVDYKVYDPFPKYVIQQSFRLPNNWFHLACHFSNHEKISRIQALYRGYRVRQRIAQWVAAKHFNHTVGTEHLMWHLRMYK